MTAYNNNQDQTPKEICFQTITEFLESYTAPNQIARIPDLAICRRMSAPIAPMNTTRHSAPLCSMIRAARAIGFSVGFKISRDGERFSTKMKLDIFISFINVQTVSKSKKCFL